MAGIASKNLFDLLDDDGAEPQAPPPKADKSAKGGKSAPAKSENVRPAGRTAQKDTSGNDSGFRDGGARQNRDRDTGDSRDFRGRGERGRGRGERGRGRGRGGRGGAPLDDRHSKTGISEHEKQAAHGWGGNTGGAEWADEQAGEAIAKEEETAGGDDANGEAATTEPVEEEPKTKSLDDYLAEQAEKRLQIGGSLEARKANEGVNKKLQKGVEFTREDEDEDFIAGSGGKKARERARKEKNVIELDGEAMRQTDKSSTDRRGGRGGPRGGSRGDFGDRRGGPREGGRGRGRGEFRGGDRPPRGDFRGGDRGRGESRGSDRARGSRGRGGPGGNAPNVSDQSAFPSLGA